MKRFIYTLCFLFLSIVIQAQEHQVDPSFGNSYYDDRERGWFWFEPEPKPEPELEEPEPLPPSPPPPTPPEENTEESSVKSTQPETKTVVIDVEWLRTNLPVLRDMAINNPSDKNIAAYYYAQRMMLDMSSRFAERTKEYFSKDTPLSEEHRRPTRAFVLDQFKSEAKDAQKKCTS